VMDPLATSSDNPSTATLSPYAITRPSISTAGEAGVTQRFQVRVIGERLSVPATSVVAMSSTHAIEAQHLVKRFGDTLAVDDVSFVVPEGSVLGLLGPNGAGKTTTVRMMTTLTRPTSGTARVAGHDVLEEPDAVRRSMGLTGQAATVDELLTGRENLRLIGQLYGLDKGYIARATEDLLERFSLADAGDRTAKTYSGGMRRRLDLAVSLIATPPVLFLDEPTTGLDPRSRVELWEVLRELVADGTTLLLTTQYLEEADQLADNIVVIDRGTVIAEGTPLQLKDQSGAAALVVTVSQAQDLDEARSLLAPHVREMHVDQGARQITAPAEGLGHMTRVAGILDDSGIVLDDIGLKRPSLDDVFLHLTGHRAEERDETAHETDHEADHDVDDTDHSREIAR
jgi:ABC-2 type transport system ATP-binding protein